MEKTRREGVQQRFGRGRERPEGNAGGREGKEGVGTAEEVHIQRRRREAGGK